MSEDQKTPTAFGFFIHPLPLAAVLVTAINDHYLKYASPSDLTGKISDFTGLFYFPLFLAALTIITGFAFSKEIRFSPGLLISCILVTDIPFVILKLSPELSKRLAEYFSATFFPVAIIADPTDLWALLSSLACYFFARRYFE